MMRCVSRELFRVLRPGGHAAVLIGDTRERGVYIPLAFRTLECLVEAGFELREDVIKVQWNCAGERAWSDIAAGRGFLLIAHEHLFVLRKSNGPSA